MAELSNIAEKKIETNETRLGMSRGTSEGKKRKFKIKLFTIKIKKSGNTCNG